MRSVPARVRDDIDIALRRIRRVRGVIDRDRFRRVKLPLARRPRKPGSQELSQTSNSFAPSFTPQPHVAMNRPSRPNRSIRLFAAIDDVHVAARFLQRRPRPVRRADRRHHRFPNVETKTWPRWLRPQRARSRSQHARRRHVARARGDPARRARHRHRPALTISLTGASNPLS